MHFRLLWITALVTLSQAQAASKLELYFNQNPKTSYTDQYRNITREGDNLEDIIVNEINKATKTVDIAIHDLNVPGIAQALVEKKKAGVKVRVVLENDNNIEFKNLKPNEIDSLEGRAKSHYLERLALIDTNGDGRASNDEILKRDTITMLSANKVPKIDDTYDGSHGSGIMHHKFLVIDGVTLVQASANFTMSDIHGDMREPKSRGNQNALMVIRDTQISKTFTNEFNNLWNFKFGAQKNHHTSQIHYVDGTKIVVKFSPSNKAMDYNDTTNGLIRSTVLRAKKSVDMALFVFSEQDIANALNERNNKGVKIAALIEPSFAYRDYSELLDMFGVYMPDTSCNYEEGNTPWRKPIKSAGIPNLPQGDMLHHKFGVVDEKISIFGSHNWSVAADQQNDEALLVIENTTIAEGFKSEHKRLMKDATLGLTPSLREIIKERHSLCDGK